MSSVNDAVVSGASASSSAGAVNLSLIKISTITQTLLGVAVTGLVVLATVVTIVLISTRAGFEPPLAFPDSATTYKNNELDIYPLANDKNPRGDNLTITYITQPDFGSAVIVDGNKVLYTAGKYWAGAVYMNYTCMNDKLTAMSTITVFVQNRVPEPISQTYTISKNSVKNQLDMFAYSNAIGQKISDIDQDLMYIANATQPSHGSVSFDSNYIYYTPTYDYIAGDYFEYCVSDFNDTACSFVNVTVMNDPPVAVTDQYQIPKNTPAAFNVMYNDYDPNNDTIVISEVTPAAYGGVSLSDSNTRVRYTPVMSSEVYSDSFSYGITDGVLFGYAYVTVDVGNVPPKAGDLTITIKKNTNETYVDLPATDVNVLDVLTITIPKPTTVGTFRLTNTPGVGKVDIDGDEYSKVINNYRLWYTPLYGINGVYSEVISYNVFDGTDTTVGTVTFNVINDAPVAVDDEITANKNLVTVYNVVANDFDPNQDDVQLNNVGATITTTQGGYYKVIDTKNIEYHPAQGFLGNDSATYTITDIQAKSADQLVATGNLRFIVVNQPPTPQDDVYTISKGHTVFLNVITNDTDPNNDIVSLAQTGTPNSGAAVTSATKGEEKGITYVALNQTYSESWYYTAKDVDEATTQALVTVHVVNDLPVPVDDNVFVKWNSTTLIDVLANDIDVNPGDKEILIISAISGATTAKGGAITIVSNKLVQYVPVLGYTGTDSFTYSIFDQMDYSASVATVNIVVGNNAPSANPTTVSVHWSNSLPVNILGITNNGDPDNDPVIVAGVTQPANGAVALVNGVATYKSTDYFTGVDSFGYTLSDWGLTNSSTVTVNVQNVAPVSAPVTLTVPWNANPTTAYVVGVCSDADNDPLTIKSLTPTAPFKGTLVVSDSSTNVRFTPSRDFSGTLTATYVVTDGPDTSSNTITITVTNVNKPTATPITRTVHWSTQTLGTTISILSVGQRDADGDALTVSAVSSPSHGTATFTNTSITYKQTAGYTGTDEFTYTITDGLDTATATVTFTIYNTNPVAIDHAYSVFWGTHTVGTTFSVLSNSSDADVQDTVTLKAVGPTAPHGTATKQGNQVVFKPTIGNLNTVTFTYTVTDGLADVVKTVTVTITDTKPVAVNDAVSVHWNTTSFDFNVKDNDYDADNDVISLQDITSQPTAGVVTIKSATAGTVTYTLPTGSFALGTYTAKYTVTDGALASDPANINIDITNANRPNAVPISTRVHWRTPNTGFSVPITGLTSFDGDGDELRLSTSGSTFATAVGGSPSFVRYVRTLWKGTDSVAYQVSDGKSSSSNVISIESYNTIPTATNIVNLYVPYTAFVNGLTINAMSLGNVNDADDDDKTFLYISAVTQPGTAGNVVTLNSTTKTINYKPALAWTGEDSFTYTVSDGLDTVTRTISVYATYIAAGDAERAYDVHWKNYQAGKNFNVLDGYGNTGNSKIIQINSTTGGNTYSILPAPDTVNNQLFFQNKRAFLDTDVIKLKANDGASTGTISVYMNVYDNAPTASNKAASGKWNQAIQTAVMTGASDPDPEDTATLGSFTSGSKGVVTKIDANTLSYSGTGGYVGTDSYTYTVTDGLLNTTRVVSVTLTNSPPVPVAQAYSVHWRTFQTGISRVVTTGATDADGNTISLVSVTQPDDASAGTTTAVTASNTVNIVGTSTPYYGKSFKFTYTVTDGAQNGQASAQVTVSVTNQAPVAVADSDSIHWRTKNFVKNVLANDYDNDNEDKPYLKITGASANLGGSVSYNNTHITYTPKALFMGTEVITYIISDGAQTASNTFTIDVTDTAPVARPIAVSMHSSKYATGIAVAVTNNPVTALKSTDADAADATFLRVSAIVQPTAPGSATYNDTSITFKSGSATQLGVSTVSFTVSDGLLTAQSAITVTVYNNAPTNTDYSGNCPWRTCLSNGVSIPVTANANDIDPEDAGALVFALATNPAYGTVTSPSNGVFLYKLKSGQGNVNADSFKFTTSDGVQTVQNTVSVSIGNVAPVARDDTYDLHWLSVQPFVLRVSDNDTDADSDPFTIQTISTTSSTNGATLSIITPARLFVNYNLPKSSITANKLGVADKFTYRLTDTVDNSNTATVSVTVYNNAPTAGSVTDSTKWNVPKTFALGALCSDPDGNLDNVAFGTLTSTPAAGSAVITVQSSGTVRYTPATGAQAASYSTPYSFTYTCTDGLLTGTGTVTVTVSNNAPTLTGNAVSVQHNYNNPVVQISGLLTRGSDADTDTLTIKSLQTQTADASVTISGNSATSDTANIRTAANFVGTKTLTWTVTDGQLTSNTANYAITLLNTAPTCAAFSRSTDKNTAATVANVAAGSGDINNDPLTFSLGDVSVGTASMSGNALTYTPAVRRSGTQTVEYVARDIIGAETTCVVSVAVANRAPVAPSKPYTLEGSHSDNHKYTLDYMTDAAVSDPDNGDTVSLISVTDGTTNSCGATNVGTVALVSGKIQWTRKSYTWVGSCNINVAVRDNDIDNPLTTNAVVSITIDPSSPFPPVANDDEYTTEQKNTLLQLPITGTGISNGVQYTGILENDEAPLGTGIVFDGLVCTTSGYCRRTPYIANNLINYNVDTTNCVQDKFQYRIKTTDFMAMTAIGTVTIKFTNCFCSAALDIFFVVDSSSSVGGTNFNTQRNFLINLTNSLDISNSKVKVGIAQFGYDGTVYRSLSGSKSDVVSTLTNLPYLSQYTNTLSGIYAALTDITGTCQNNGTYRYAAKGRANVPKVIVIVTDGVSNAPCSCSRSDGGRFANSGRQMTCQGLYGGTKNNYESKCLSDGYPNRDCGDCSGSSSGCFPCADPVKLTDEINSWNTSTGGTTPPSAYSNLGFYNWKVVAIGVGALVDNSFGKNQISLMHYDHDPNKVLLASWENLENAVNSVVDAACNTQQ